MLRPILPTIAPFFRDDGATVYHGDCLELLPLIAAESVDFVLTDPPYLVDFTGRWDRSHSAIRGDADGTWLLPAYREIHRILKRDALLVSFYGWPHADRFVGAFKSVGFRPVSHLAFVKDVWGLGRFTRGQHETAFLLAKGSPRVPEPAISDVITWRREHDAVHPNQKPVPSLCPLIATYAPAGGIVLDPFMGSGSTLRAARDLGCLAVGMEIEERWCRYAADRLRQGVLFT